MSLEEIQIKLSLSNVDIFVNDAILSSLRMVEGFSARTRYNLTGLADALKTNPQFASLTKQLYLKYNYFNNTPPEVQLGLVIIGTSYLVVIQNQQRNKFQQPTNENINDFLNARV